MRATNRKTCFSAPGSNTCAWVCQTNALPVRPLSVHSAFLLWDNKSYKYFSCLDISLLNEQFWLGSLYPEWPHRQGGCLACWGCMFDSRWGFTDLYYAWGTQEVLPMRVGGATSQLYLLSLTPLSVAGCGRLQLGVPHLAASVHYCK